MVLDLLYNLVKISIKMIVHNPNNVLYIPAKTDSRNLSHDVTNRDCAL